LNFKHREHQNKTKFNATQQNPLTPVHCFIHPQIFEKLSHLQGKRERERENDRSGHGYQGW